MGQCCGKCKIRSRSPKVAPTTDDVSDSQNHQVNSHHSAQAWTDGQQDKQISSRSEPSRSLNQSKSGSEKSRIDKTHVLSSSKAKSRSTTVQTTSVSDNQNHKPISCQPRTFQAWTENPKEKQVSSEPSRSLSQSESKSRRGSSKGDKSLNGPQPHPMRKVADDIAKAKPQKDQGESSAAIGHLDQETLPTQDSNIGKDTDQYNTIKLATSNSISGNPKPLTCKNEAMLSQSSEAVENSNNTISGTINGNHHNLEPIPNLDNDKLEELVRNVIVPTFHEQRNYNENQFAVLFLASEEDLNDIVSIKFRCSSSTSSLPLTNYERTSWPPVQYYHNYIVARPMTVREACHAHEKRKHAEENILKDLDELWNKFQVHNGGIEPSCIIFYSWNFPCPTCTELIIQTLGCSPYINVETYLLATAWYREVSHEDRKDDEREMENNDIMVLYVRDPLITLPTLNR